MCAKTSLRSDLSKGADGRPRAPIEADGLLQDQLPCALPSPLGDDLAVDDQLKALQLTARPGPGVEPVLLPPSDVDPVTRPVPSIDVELQDRAVRREAPSFTSFADMPAWPSLLTPTPVPAGQFPLFTGVRVFAKD